MFIEGLYCEYSSFKEPAGVVGIATGCKAEEGWVGFRGLKTKTETKLRGLSPLS
jgi:hypothetical protein